MYKLLLLAFAHHCSEAENPARVLRAASDVLIGAARVAEQVDAEAAKQRPS